MTNDETVPRGRAVARAPLPGGEGRMRSAAIYPHRGRRNSEAQRGE
jgi:hypothetical protein